MKKLFSALLSAALLAGVAAIPVSASSESDAELLQIATAYTYYSEGSPNITAVRPAENGIVSRYFWNEIEGIAVYCEDPSALEGAVIGDYTLTPEYTAAGGYVSYSSYADMVELLNRSNPSDTDYNISLELPAIYTQHTDNLYILRSSTETFVEALDQQTLFTPIGVMVSDWYTYGYFYGAETPLYVVAEAEGLDTAALETATDYALTAVESGYGQTNEVLVHHFEFTDMTADISLEDAIAVCDQLKVCDGVADAWIAGQYNPSTEYYYTNSASIKGLSSYHFGDINEDGTVDSADAMLALEEYTAVSLLEQASALNLAQQVAADMDSDGVITAADAIAILTRYAESLA